MLNSLHVLLLTSGIFLVAATVLTTTTLGASALDRYVMTVASSGLPYKMYGIAYEPGASYVLVSAYSTNNIKKVTLDTWYVTTFAGSTSGYSGLVDGVGTSARFRSPVGMVWDASRTAFMIADYSNNNIRKMTSGASVTTYAGSTSGTSGYVHGTTTTARFNDPLGIAVFGSTLVVADYSNNAIRSISSSGYVSNLASSVTNPFGITTTSSYVYTNDGYSIVRIDSAGTVTTIAGSVSSSGNIIGYGTSARFDRPRAMTVLPDGSILVSSVTYDLIRHINTSTQYVSTYTGSGTASDTDGDGTSASLYNPYALQYFSINSTDYLFVGTYAKLRTIGTPAPVSTSGGYVETLTSALSSYKYGIAHEPNSDYILFTSYSTENIKKVTIGTWAVTTFAGSVDGYSGLADGIGTSARFNYPWGMVWDATRTAFMIADSWNYNIRKMTSGASVTTYAGSTAGSSGSVDGTTTSARFYNPRGIAVFGSTLVVADYSNSAIRSISSSGYVSTLASSVTTPLAITASSSYVYTNSGSSIVRIDSAGTVTTIAGSASAIGTTDGTGSMARFGSTIYGMTMLPDGSLLVSHATYDLIRHINTSSYYVSTYAGTGSSSTDINGYGTSASLYNPYALQYLSINGVGYVFVSTYYYLRRIGLNNTVTPVPATSTTPAPPYTTTTTTPAPPYTTTPTPPSTTTTASSSAGYVQTVATSLPYTMYAVAYEPGASYVLVSAYSTNNIKKVTLGTWSVSTFAGSTSGYSGLTNAVGTSARFDSPDGMVWDASRTAFMIADYSNNNIRKMTSGASVTTYAGSTSGSSGSAAGTTTSARFYNPTGIAVFGSTLVVADKNNNAIRSISSSGYVSTLASSITTPLAITASSSYVYFNSGYSIVRYSASSGAWTTVAGSVSYSGYTNGYGTSARFGFAQGMTLLSDGSILVSSATNDVIRHINPSSYYVSTYVGTGTESDINGYGTSASLDDPRGLQYLSINNTDYLFVCTYGRLRTIGGTPAGGATTAVPSSYYTTPVPSSSVVAGYVQTVATGLPYTMYGLGYQPGASYILIAESTTESIKKVTLGTWSVSTFAGSTSGYSGLTDGIGTGARFFNPNGMVWDASRTAFMLADSSNNNIRKMTSGASVTTYAGSTAGAPGYTDSSATYARFKKPTGIAVFGSTLVIADQDNNAVRSISSSGYVSTLASSVSRTAVITASSAYVYTNSGYSIVRISASGSTTTIAGSVSYSGYTDGYGTSARFGFSQGMTLLPDGSILVSDATNDVIRHIDPSSYYVSTYVGTGTESDINGYGTSASLDDPRALQYFSTSSGGYLFVCTYGKLRTIGLSTSTPTPTVGAGGTPSPVSGKAGFIPGTSEAGSTGIVVSLSLLFVICCIIIIVVVVCCVRKKPPPPEEKNPNVSPQAPYPEPEPENVEMQPQPSFDGAYMQQPPPYKFAAVPLIGAFNPFNCKPAQFPPPPPPGYPSSTAPPPAAAAVDPAAPPPAVAAAETAPPAAHGETAV